jgi:DNA invertase Pin-like site-specific DNA recombinase
MLVVTKLDRLGRDAHDVGATLKGLAGRGIAVVVIQLGRLDLTSPAGRLMLTMLGAVAEMERDLLVERTCSGLDRARSQGKTLGRPVKVAPKDRRELIELRQAGVPISALARRFTVSRATISRIVEVEAGTAQAGQTTPDSRAPQTTPAKLSTRTRKAAAGRAGDDMDRAAMEQQHGQRRLPAV